MFSFPFIRPPRSLVSNSDGIDLRKADSKLRGERVDVREFRVFFTLTFFSSRLLFPSSGLAYLGSILAQCKAYSELGSRLREKDGVFHLKSTLVWLDI